MGGTRAGKAASLATGVPLLGMLVLAGCSGPDPAELDSAMRGDKLATHLLVLDSRGRTKPLPSQMGKPPGPVWQPAEGEDASEGYMELKDNRALPIEIMFTSFANDFAGNKSVNKLLFYFNGGLGEQDNLIVRANVQHDLIEEAGFYPVFMIWPTGAFDTYFEQVYKTYNGRYYYSPQPVLGTFRVLTNFLQGLASTPVDWVYDTARFTRVIVLKECDFYVNDPPLHIADDTPPEEVNRARDCLAKDQMPHRVRDKEISDAERQVIVSPMVNAEPSRQTDFFWLTATTLPRIASVPFADGLGTEAWKNMLRRTRTTVHADQEVEGMDGGWDRLRARYPNGAGGFAQFFSLLRACSRDGSGDPAAAGTPCPSGVTPAARAKLKATRLTLIGHSMGAIVINELVRGFPDLDYEDVVFLSGAASIRATISALDPLLSRGQGRTRFYNLMLHPMNEEREIHVKGAVPSGSLLVWIDEMLEQPDTSLDRTVGQWANMEFGRRAFSIEARRWMHLKVFDWTPRQADGRVLAVIEHGGYNEPGVNFWERSIWSSETGKRCADPVRFPNEGPLPLPAGCPPTPAPQALSR